MIRKLSRASLSQMWIAPVAFTAALALTPSMRCQESASPDTKSQDANAAATSMGFTVSSCAQNLAIGNFTLCGEVYNDVSTATNVTVNYSPSPNNAIIAWATWCFTSSCNTSISGVTATIGDNINATESCFVASPHSPFITDGNGGAQGSGDFQQHYVWYCPSIPSGVTSFTVTPTNPNLSYLQLNITEWKAGSLAPSCSPISACFENVDNLGQAGNSTGGTTATITTSGPTVNANDLIFAVTEVPCCSFTARPGTGYTGITVAPAVTPGMVSEAKAATSAGIQTATSSWTGGNTSWFGVIVPVIGAATTTTSALQFIPVTPCRIADTRNAAGAFGGPELSAGSMRTFNIPQSSCGIPSTAVAYSLNATVVPNQSLGYLTLWPAGQAQPYVSTLNSDGRVKADAAITAAGTKGGVSVYVTDATQFIMDIDGYFVPAGTSSVLAFYPLTPCRIADTRDSTGPLGGPFLSGQTSRAFPILSSNCNIPSTAQAYSLNVTAVPHSTLN